MATTFKAVTDTMVDLNLPVWQVKSRTGGTLLGYQLNEKMDVDSSIERLKKLLTEITADSVKVTLLPSLTKGKSGGNVHNQINMEVDLSSLRPPVAVSGIAAVNSASKYEQLIQELNDRNNKLAQQLIETKYQQQIEQLNKKIEGLETAKPSDPINRLLELVIPIALQNPAISGWIGGLLGNGAAAPTERKDINGIEEENLSPIDRLEKIDPDYISFIDAVATAAESDAKQYFMYKEMLVKNGKK
jgi:hypothetical protein